MIDELLDRRQSISVVDFGAPKRPTHRVDVYGIGYYLYEPDSAVF